MVFRGARAGIGRPCAKASGERPGSCPVSRKGGTKAGDATKGRAGGRGVRTGGADEWRRSTADERTRGRGADAVERRNFSGGPAVRGYSDPSHDKRALPRRCGGAP